MEFRRVLFRSSLKRSVHIRCPRCPQMVYLVRHNGGSVWLDELGWPWPKHGCFDSQPHDSGNTSVAPIPSVMFSVTEKGALSVRGMGEFRSEERRVGKECRSRWLPS